MDTVAGMNAEAARCFRRACEASDPLDHSIFIGLRQAWLALAQQVERRMADKQRLILPADTVESAATSGTKKRPSSRARHKAREQRRPSSRTRRKTLAA